MLVFSSCNSDDNKIAKIQYIDKLTDDHSSLINRVFTDTSITKNDTIYTQYHYDNSTKLTIIYIEETATDNKYVSYINNDSLIKITVKNRNPNYISDDAASYYIDNDSVFHKVETRGKLEDLNKFIFDQKRNIKFFKDSLTKKLQL